MSNNNWISINKQKPSDGQEVIILYNEEPRIAVASKSLDGRIIFDFCFTHIDGAEFNAMSRFEDMIKYWQPLPKAPTN